MHFKPNVYSAEMEALLRRFVQITGWQDWRRRLDGLTQQIKVNPLVREYIQERHGLELQMAYVQNHRRVTRRIPEPATYEQSSFLAFVSMVARVHQRLSKAGQRRLEGMLRDGLKSVYGLIPLQHEMGVAASLMHRGFDVEFFDIENGGGPDFIAARDEIALEVECKNASADLGRQVHRQKLYLLSKCLMELMRSFLDLNPGGHFVSVQLPGKLFGRDEILEKIAAAVDEVLKTRTQRIQPGICDVSYFPFEFYGSPFDKSNPEQIDQEAARDFISEKFGTPNRSVLFMFHPGHGTIAVEVASVKPDRVLSALESQLKDTVKSQFTGTRPAVLAVKFSDLSEGELIALAKQDIARDGPPSALQIMTNGILEREDWRFVHSITFLTPGHLEHNQSSGPDGVQQYVSERGEVYSFRNRHHPNYDDRRYSILWP